MTWKDSRPEYRDAAGHCVVGRPALETEFYSNNRESRLKSHANAILDRFLALLPAAQELYLLAGPADRQYKKVGPQRMKKVREELKKGGGIFSFKTSPGFDVGEFSVELSIGGGKWSSDYVIFGFPLVWGEAPKANDADGFFRSLVTDFPFRSAVAGFGFDIVWGREFEMISMVENFRQANQYHGLLIRNRMQEDFLVVNENSLPVDKIKSAGWRDSAPQEGIGLQN
jgi:hypothetical protein